MDDSKRELYNELAKECGVVIEKNSYSTIDSETASEQIDKIKVKKKFAYEDDTTILPDSEYVNRQLDETLNKEISKEDAVENMLYKTAVLKARNESEDMKELLSKEEYEQQKKEIVNYLLYQQEQAYYSEYKFMMDGKTKRKIRKKLEREYDAGKYRPNKSKLNG